MFWLNNLFIYGGALYSHFYRAGIIQGAQGLFFYFACSCSAGAESQLVGGQLQVQVRPIDTDGCMLSLIRPCQHLDLLVDKDSFIFLNWILMCGRTQKGKLLLVSSASKKFAKPPVEAFLTDS